MTIVTKITYNRFPELLQRFPAVVDAIVQKTALDLEADVKARMAEPKHGRTYRRGAKNHIASAPGEAPAIDTGNLVNSIQSEKTGAGSAVVFTVAEYAPALEFGSVRMAARPAFRPAAEKVRAPFIAALRQLENRVK